MADPKSRNWSTKTLARELVRFLNIVELGPDATLTDLLSALKDAIVFDEVGTDMDVILPKRPSLDKPER